MDLKALIRKRQAEIAAESALDGRPRANAGSLRDLADRAATAGYPLSHATIGSYANGTTTAYPSEKTRLALAAALGVNLEEVTAAALESAAPELLNEPEAVNQLEHARVFLRLTEGRSNAEIEQLLGVIRAALRAIDASH